MWDYLLRILRTDEIRQKTTESELLSAARSTEPIRTSTETDREKSSDQFSGRSIQAEPLFCPVCHVRMNREAWKNAQLFICPECNGAFLNEHSLEEVLGTVIEISRQSNNPLIYTPKGLTDHIGDIPFSIKDEKA